MLKVIIVTLLVVLGFAVGFWFDMFFIHIKKPTISTPLPIGGDNLSQKLQSHVKMLALTIGERNIFHPGSLDRAADYIENEFQKSSYEVKRQSYDVSGQTVFNIIAELKGKKEDIIVIGAHYDSVFGSSGADDNASGVAAVLELADYFAGQKLQHTFRFIAFVNEEPPFFKTANMGSMRYAKDCHAKKDPIKLMISVESIGYFSAKKGSQGYPFPLHFFYPEEANFVALIGNLSSRRLVKQILMELKKTNYIPFEGANLPSLIPGVDWSDHWSFWQEDYEAIMITDTVPYRNPHYHKASDLPETLDYERFKRTVESLKVIARFLDSKL